MGGKNFTGQHGKKLIADLTIELVKDISDMSQYCTLHNGEKLIEARGWLNRNFFVIQVTLKQVGNFVQL